MIGVLVGVLVGVDSTGPVVGVDVGLPVFGGLMDIVAFVTFIS